MNKLALISIIYAWLLSCQSTQKEGVDSYSKTGITDTNQISFEDTVRQFHDKDDKQGAIVQPDTTVNRKLVLENYASAKTFYSNIDAVELVEQLRGSPVMVFDNIGNDEYLLTYQYEGNTKNSFSMFEIGYVKDLKEVGKNKVTHSNEKSFKTESGLSLGSSLDDVIKIKGSSFKRMNVNNVIILRYVVEDFTQSAFLKRYNMPSYFIELVFKENKVVKLSYGFDYP